MPKNIVTIIPQPDDEVLFGRVPIGTLFRLPGSQSATNVYMKVNPRSLNSVAVMLSTGEIYDFDVDRVIKPLLSGTEVRLMVV